MKTSISSFLLLFAIQSFSCSEGIVENTAGVANSGTAQSVENRPTPTVSDQSTQTHERNFSSDSQDVVLSSGKDYIKKTGWKVPSSNETYIIKKEPDMGTTTYGKEVKVNTVDYKYKAPKSYSEDFYYEGPNLKNMKGKLLSGGFREYSVNGRIFMYTVFAEKVVPAPASNSDPHVDPFVYQIMDADGDGIFETLRGDYDMIVPNWVLK